MEIGTSNNILSHIRSVKAATDRPEVAARQPTETRSAGDSPVLLTGYDNILALGRLALGPSQVESWESKGLEITNETLEAAYEAFNQAFKASMDSPRSGGISINAHQIVADHQAVPEWFLHEQKLHLEANEAPGAKATFARGEYFHISDTASTVSRALKAYSDVQFGFSGKIDR
ncbi:hypothetical protein [Marinimicrobium sp. ARAG 43.8]|uniref:hypothetical protein n=1 Tax=Marinimicrobium sp. ARAG 43.8 TaxID=3418719 RepID=UPI003CF7E006